MIFKPTGVCANKITFNLNENDTITGIKFFGVYLENIQGFSHLIISKSTKQYQTQK